MLYTCSNQELYGLQPDNRDRLYQERLGGKAVVHCGLGGVGWQLYLASEDGDVFVVKTGRIRLLATNKVGEVVMASPPSQTANIVRGLNHIFAFGKTLRRRNPSK